jgi:hypothetical protein
MKYHMESCSNQKIIYLIFYWFSYQLSFNCPEAKGIILAILANHPNCCYEMVVLLEGSPISTEELCSVRVVIGFLVTSLTKALLTRLLSLAWRQALESFGGSELLPFKNDGGHCVLGDLQCCRHFLPPFPRSVPRHNHVSALYGQFLRPRGLVFALTCTVNCGT